VSRVVRPAAGLQDRVRRHAVEARPYLVPELRLHLITPDCGMWSASEAEVEAAGLGAPYWAFAWAGGQALARFVLDHPRWVADLDVLDFGGGSGIEGLAAVRAGARRVLASDVDPLAVAAMDLNAALNGLELETTGADLVDEDVDAQVILAGDVTYEADLARRVRGWLERQAARGRTVLIADPDRGFLDGSNLETLAVYDAPSDVDADGRHRVPTRVARVCGIGLGLVSLPASGGSGRRAR